MVSNKSVNNTFSIKIIGEYIILHKLTYYILFLLHLWFIVPDLTKPPKNAVNRGIGVQGISTIFASLLGTGSGISSSSENVGNIGITRVCILVIIIPSHLPT